MKAIDEPFYWYARGTRLHTGITYPGQQTDSGVPEFECGTKEEIILKLEKHRDELPTERTGFINTENGIESVEVEKHRDELPTDVPGFINTENGIEFVGVENASEEMPQKR